MPSQCRCRLTCPELSAQTHGPYIDPTTRVSKQISTYKHKCRHVPNPDSGMIVVAWYVTELCEKVDGGSLSGTHRAHHENLGRVSSRVRVGSCSTNYLMYNKIGHGMP